MDSTAFILDKRLSTVETPYDFLLQTLCETGRLDNLLCQLLQLLRCHRIPFRCVSSKLDHPFLFVFGQTLYFFDDLSCCHFRRLLVPTLWRKLAPDLDVPLIYALGTLWNLS